jgi:hypothetical protein
MKHLPSILAFLALAVDHSALAQTTETASLTIKWTAPTTDSNGNPLAGSVNAVTSYKVYLSTTTLSGVPTVPVFATATATGTSVTGSESVQVGQTLYAYVTACNATGCSALSAPGTYVAQAPAASPGIPTIVTVTVTITS